MNAIAQRWVQTCRHRRQRRPQPLDVHPAPGECGIKRPMTAAVLTDQRQLHQRPDRPIRAQHRVGQPEQRIRPRHEALVELLAEPGQLPERTGNAGIMHSDQLKPLVVIFQLSQEGMVPYRQSTSCRPAATSSAVNATRNPVCRLVEQYQDLEPLVPSGTGAALADRCWTSLSWVSQAKVNRRSRT
jgi:hypothetical protein